MFAFGLLSRTSLHFHTVPTMLVIDEIVKPDATQIGDLQLRRSALAPTPYFLRCGRSSLQRLHSEDRTASIMRCQALNASTSPRSRDSIAFCLASTTAEEPNTETMASATLEMLT